MPGFQTLTLVEGFLWTTVYPPSSSPPNPWGVGRKLRLAGHLRQGPRGFDAMRFNLSLSSSHTSQLVRFQWSVLSDQPSPPLHPPNGEQCFIPLFLVYLSPRATLLFFTAVFSMPKQCTHWHTVGTQYVSNK